MYTTSAHTRCIVALFLLICIPIAVSHQRELTAKHDRSDENYATELREVVGAMRDACLESRKCRAKFSVRQNSTRDEEDLFYDIKSMLGSHGVYKNTIHELHEMITSDGDMYRKRHDGDDAILILLQALAIELLPSCVLPGELSDATASTYYIGMSMCLIIICSLAYVASFVISATKNTRGVVQIK